MGSKRQPRRFRVPVLLRVGAGAAVLAAVVAAVTADASWPAMLLVMAAVAMLMASFIYSISTASGSPAGWQSRIFAGGPRPVDRRSAVRFLGLSALFAGPVTVVPRVLDSVLKPDSSESAVAAQLGPAQVPASRVRQWTMIVDLRFCDGCQSVRSAPRCTSACIAGHFAPEPMEWIEVYEAELEGEGTRFLPTPCQHCQNPPCVNVCPVAATFSSPEGLVLIDQNRCIGCRICMAACPYDRRFFNWGAPPVPPDVVDAEYDIEVQAPALKGTVMKCDFCPDMVRAGTLPYCIQACPNDAIYYGDLEEDVASNGVDVVSISNYLADNDAFRLKEELGTQPRVFYVPGHGEAVGRNPRSEGLLPTTWPWIEQAEGSDQWSR